MTPAPPPSDIDPDDDTASADFARALSEFERRAPAAVAATGAAAAIVVGAKLHGRVVALTSTHALIEFGGRSEAVAELGHFRADDGSVRIAVGDVLDLFVIEAADQIVLAPSMRTEGHAALAQLRAAQASGVPVSGRVTGVNAGGLEVEVGGVRSFCPLSQIESGFCADPKLYVGRTLEFVVTAVEDGRGGAKLSRRKVLQQAEAEQARRVIAGLKPGDTLDGTVARLETFGAFVDLGGVDGMVHVSEIGYSRLEHPRDGLREGERVRVRVLRVETGAEGGKPRIALSIKATLPDPWSSVAQRFSPGMRVSGAVSRIAEFGAFVTLAPGVDGLVHVSEAALGRVARVKDVLAPGDLVEAIVLSVDPEKRRIGLSVKQALEGYAPAAPAERRAAASRDRGATAKAAPARPPGARSAARPAPASPGPTVPPGPGATDEGPAPAQPPGPVELTPMAIALRKAMERARRSGGEQPSSI